ncbi:MAG: phosphopantothenate/pantothenate synthetase [Thermoplasmata archaeon HGW-Thermoplasmata-1]|nr:MAG: phosphopantothenate/pantothenate synthetase [Thermoplasmata archaeon HGW-Thermoplasmata-1]
MASNIPKDHPRYLSLMTRERMADALKRGLIHETGLIAHGRGEAFDYLLGEKTPDVADEAARVAAAHLLLAKNPVISMNGNDVALAAAEAVELAGAVNAKIEVNLFHRSPERVSRLVRELEAAGGKGVLGENPDALVSGLSHDRAMCTTDGIHSADVVLVPLEDGDRCKALLKMGKTVIAIDLNPLSRTARGATVTIVDNIVRAIPNMTRHAKILSRVDRETLLEITHAWDNEEGLRRVMEIMVQHLSQASFP